VGFFFVDLPFIGAGVGRWLFGDLLGTVRSLGLTMLRIDADPGAADFYERMGARYVGDVPSGSIPGRSLPSYRLQLA
jgi:GNAT superfamily N-acetyltransferase